ncbi:MAG: hypothetical protein J6Z45_05955 [Oscillospiraceae bacterium]|nr:hypothetical protein [Oscillospiraceae bacterium]
MKNLSRRVSALLAAALALSAFSLTACHKGDGTEKIAVPVRDDSDADRFDAMFTDLTEDKNAKKDTPVAIDGTVRPKQGIVMVMVYDNTEEELSHTQAVNYFDSDGNTYRYRHPVDADGDFLTPLLEEYRTGATVVNIMSEEERNTLWSLAAKADTLRNADFSSKLPGKDVYGSTALYLIDENNEPILIAKYDDTSVCRSDPDAVAFADWFRYFYHPGFTFGG